MSPFGQLLKSARPRDAAALLVRDHAGEVQGLCRAMVRDPAIAEDLAQDTFSRAFVAMHEFRDESSPRTWLLTIARNRCTDWLRREGRRPYDLSDSVDEEAGEELPPVQRLADREDVSRALRTLDETARALVVLRFRHGLGYPELAEAFGVGQGAIRMRVSRALAQMRQELEPIRMRTVAPRMSPPPPASAPASAPAGAPASGGAPFPGAPPPPQAPPLPRSPAPTFSFEHALASYEPPPSSSLRERLVALLDAI